jgi:protein TonB
MSLHSPEFALVNNSTRYGSAQSYSVAVHMAILCSLLFLLASSGTRTLIGQRPIVDTFPGPPRYTPRPEWMGERPSLGHRGRGGGNEAEPARKGLFAPESSMPLTTPRLPHVDQVALPVAPAVFDPRAPVNVPLATDLGLPQMPVDTNSAGTGKGHGIGDREGDAMGDEQGKGAGVGDDPGNYANVISHAMCLYCPEPPYSDEARKAKLQGLVTLRVLIGTDGRAKRVQLAKGLGMGLDESAVQAVRAWRFVPARDASKQPLATWVTIETRFQLF